MKDENPLLHLGATQSGKGLWLDPAVRTTHMHVPGASGRGKSYFLQHLIQQDIDHGHGLCLIDPHGTLYHKIVAWCAAKPAARSWDKLILLDASAPGWTFGFNPLDFGGADIAFAVDAMVSAVAQVWGGEDTNKTPALKKVLRGVFHVLAEQGLTLLEASYLIAERPESRPLRERLTRDVADSVIRELWAEWNQYKPQDFHLLFGSTTNRLMEFVSTPVVRSIIGQKEWTIDLRKVMDEGGIVLVNLQPRGRLTEFNARTLGTLLTHDLFLRAQDRPEGSRPFYVYIDECGRYLNESIQRILDESRKRGLHLILANQHLSQLRAAGDTVYSAIMTDAQTKVIFGGLETEDAETLVKEVFLDLDLEEPKHSLTRRVAVGQEAVILRSGSTGRGATTGRARTRASGYSTSTGTSTGESESESRTRYPDATESEVATGAWGVSASTTTSESYSYSEAETESEAASVTEMTGWVESFKTLYADAITPYTLEEQRYKKVAWLKKQPRQMALLVQPDFSLIPFRVATVTEPAVLPGKLARFVQRRREALPFVLPAHESNRLIEERRRALQQRLGGPDEIREIDPYEND